MKGVFKKRRNVGKPKLQVSRPGNQTQTPSTSRPSASVEARPKVSASKVKLERNLSMYDKKLLVNKLEYDVINIAELESNLEDIASCRFCQHRLSLSKTSLSGLAVVLKITCKNCEAKKEFLNSKAIRTDVSVHSKGNILYDVNLRLVLGLRSVGLGYAAAETLCGVMNFHQPPNRYFRYDKFLGQVSKKVCKDSMKTAVKEAVEANNGIRELCVAIDGSWQKRGHTSLNGILSVTSADVGKVLDISVLSKHCRCPNKLRKEHLSSCTANYSGTSGGMEVAGALEVFRRSVPEYDVQYTEYLGDGDSNGYKAVCEDQPYGNSVQIYKAECIGHVMKRMGTRLRTMLVKHPKLPDGSALGGKGRLTKAAVKKIQIYYGLAIRRKHHSVKEMKEAIWAEYCHLRSTNENPTHNLCPKDPDTWCKYNKAMLEKKKYDHNKHLHLPYDIMKAIEPIFKDLSEKTLLEKCIKGKTQNPNESLNNVIWSKISKKTFVSLETLKFGVYQAVSSFNDGHMGILKTFEKMHLEPGKNCVEAMKKADQKRIKHGEKCFEEVQKKIRQKLNVNKRKLEEQYEQEEDPDNPSYAPGFY